MVQNISVSALFALMVSANHIIGLEHQPECQRLLAKMYNVVTENIFEKKNKHIYNPIINA